MFREMLLTSWEKHLSKHSLIIDHDVINLQCKTSRSTGFENESQYVWRQNGSVFKRKNLGKFLNSRQLLCHQTTLCNINSHQIFYSFFVGNKIITQICHFACSTEIIKFLSNIKLSVALDLKTKVIFLAPKWQLCNIHQFQTTILCHWTLHYANFHQIFCSFIWLEDNYYSDILFPLFVRNNHQVLRNIKLPVALGLKEKVIFWRKNGSIFEAQNPSKSPKLQLNIICHQRTLYKISYIIRYINKTCLNLKKPKKNLICTLYITQTAGKKNNIQRRLHYCSEHNCKVQKVLSKYANGKFIASKENVSDNIQSG